MKEAIDSFVIDRMNSFCKNIYEDDKHKTLDEKRQQMIKDIKESMSKGDFEMVKKLVSIIEVQTASDEEILYKDGFFDGIRFCVEMLKKL